MLDPTSAAARACLLARLIRDQAGRNVAWQCDGIKYILTEDGKPLARADDLDEIVDMLTARLEAVSPDAELDAWIAAVLQDPI